MYRTFKLLIIVAMLPLAFGVGKAGAAAANRTSGGWGGTISVVSGDLGVGKPAAATSLTSSAAVEIGYQTDASNIYFVALAQHQSGSLMYGLHNLGGKVYAAPVVVGTWLAPVVTVDASASVTATGFVAQ